MSAADELKRLIADAESLNGSALYMDKYLKLHYRDFLALIEAAERSLATEQAEAKAKLSVEIAENNYTDSKPESAAYVKALLASIKASEALREALKPFTKGAK